MIGAVIYSIVMMLTMAYLSISFGYTLSLRIYHMIPYTHTHTHTHTYTYINKLFSALEGLPIERF